MVDILNPNKATMYPIGEPPWRRSLPLVEGARVEEAFDQVMSGVASMQRGIQEEFQSGVAQVPQLDGKTIAKRPLTGEDIRTGSRTLLTFSALQIVWVYCSVAFAAQKREVEELREQIAVQGREIEALAKQVEALAKQVSGVAAHSEALASSPL